MLERMQVELDLVHKRVHTRLDHAQITLVRLDYISFDVDHPDCITLVSCPVFEELFIITGCRKATHSTISASTLVYTQKPVLTSESSIVGLS